MNQGILITDKHTHDSTKKVAIDIMKERIFQKEKWGEQTHPIPDWIMILAEEFGEACKAANESCYRGEPLNRLRKELIQTAAVCFAIVEGIDNLYG